MEHASKCRCPQCLSKLKGRGYRTRYTYVSAKNVFMGSDGMWYVTVGITHRTDNSRKFDDQEWLVESWNKAYNKNRNNR